MSVVVTWTSKGFRKWWRPPNGDDDQAPQVVLHAYPSATLRSKNASPSSTCAGERARRYGWVPP